jgi:hypothetical protein
MVPEFTVPESQRTPAFGWLAAFAFPFWPLLRGCGWLANMPARG